MCVNNNGSNLIYSTFIGSDESGSELSYDIFVDDNCNCYIAGCTIDGYPTTSSAYDRTYNGGNYDVFVSKLDKTGSSLRYSTYLGGIYSEKCF